MTVPFHPLADIFPLIEGAEFDELVTSIKENGQRESIVMVAGSILDGRNRYRACMAAGIEPRFDEFTGADPVKFVIDINVRRRHLNESQRAMIAAKLAVLTVGRPHSTSADEIVEISTISETGGDHAAAVKPLPISAAHAADMMNVNRQTVFSAKKVLNEGTAEEIKAVQDGKAAVSTIAREIRKNKPAEQRKQGRESSLSLAGNNPRRIENQRLNGQIWGLLRDALINLTSLPLSTDVVLVARNLDKTGLVDTRILSALEWLEGFSDAWTRGGDQAQTENPNRNGTPYAGDGGKSS